MIPASQQRTDLSTSGEHKSTLDEHLEASLAAEIPEAYNPHGSRVTANPTCFVIFTDAQWPHFCQNNGFPMQIYDLIAELDELQPDEKLHWLVEFANELPDLSPGRQGAPFPENCRVQECQTAVHLWVDVVAGKVHLEADVPQKSPTVRGLVALIVCGLEGTPVAEVLPVLDDLIAKSGLAPVLGMTRQQGFRGVIARIKQQLLPVK
jgi:cysteine desulfuration protein SufE